MGSLRVGPAVGSELYASPLDSRTHVAGRDLKGIGSVVEIIGPKIHQIKTGGGRCTARADGDNFPGIRTRNEFVDVECKRPLRGRFGRDQIGDVDNVGDVTVDEMLTIATHNRRGGNRAAHDQVRSGHSHDDVLKFARSGNSEGLNRVGQVAGLFPTGEEVCPRGSLMDSICSGHKQNPSVRDDGSQCGDRVRRLLPESVGRRRKIGAGCHILQYGIGCRVPTGAGFW